MIEAGSETTSSALNSCILYLSAYPDVRVCAHEELDRVVGQNRSPGFDDAPQLPYIRSIVKEILRLRPVTNMGTPHYTTADTYYKGYVIPKGSVVAIQQYPIHYDSHLFPDPEQFKPERYLSHPHKSGIYAASPNPHRDHWAFGAGRRICSGMHLAENSLFITIAKILWAFDIVPPAGHKTDLTDDAYEPGANTLPKPFPTNFIPRSKGIESKIRSEWEDALETGYTLRDIKEDL
jgi:cytochrome P450